MLIEKQPKQETLEEVAKRESQLGEYDRSFESTREKYFIKGAKWQQEQNKNLYTEEEVYTLLNDALWDLSKMGYNQKKLDEWFEQFKKK